MKISLITYGSRGDTQPFLALAVGLQKAGHKPILAAPEQFNTLAVRHNVPFLPLPGNPEELSRAFNDASSNPFRMITSMRKHVLGIAPRVVAQVLQAAQNTDLLIHSLLFTTGGHSLARSLNIPDVSIQSFPIFAPTGDYPNVALPPLGRAGNYFSHRLATQIFWRVGNAGFRQIQHLLPDSFPRTLYWPFESGSTTPLLFAISPSVIPPSTDWERPVHITGYLFLDDENYQPPAALSRFLESGPPPVCVSFGSMVNRESERIGKIPIETITQARERAVILTGWGGWKASPPPENILYLDAAPHSWLFPRCKLVIHHGGAGTTAAGLRAGIPNIIVPHAVDQPFWGRRVRAIGAGPAPIPVRKLTVARLLTALAQAETPATISAAQATARLIRAENGVDAAIHLLSRKGLFP